MRFPLASVLAVSFFAMPLVATAQQAAPAAKSNVPTACDRLSGEERLSCFERFNARFGTAGPDRREPAPNAIPGEAAPPRSEQGGSVQAGDAKADSTAGSGKPSEPGVSTQR